MIAAIAGSLFGVLARFFLGLFVKHTPSLSPEAVAAAAAAQDHITAAISTKSAVTEAAIAQAEVAAPVTKDATVKSLDDGSF